MLSTLSLDDQAGTAVTLHETAKRSVSKASGLVGVTTLRDSRRVRPQAHGGIDQTRFEDGRLIAVEGQVGSQVSIEDAFAEFRAIVSPMIATLDGTASLLKWTEGVAGLQLQRLVRLASDVDPPIQEGAALLNYAAQFYAEDPRAYSQTLQTATSPALSVVGGGRTYPSVFPRTYALSGGGAVTFTNGGNRSTPPVFRIHGFCLNPQIVLLGSPQKRIVLNGLVVPGDYLEVDVAARTIRVNGSVSRLNFLDAANSQWFELPPGTSSLQLVAGAFDSSAYLDVLGRSAYS